MDGEGNGSRLYRVIVSESVRARLIQLKDIAAERGISDQFLSVLRSVVRRLEVDPYGVGEPKFTTGQFLVCLGVLAPLRIRFGIHQTIPMIWITEIDLF